MSKALARLVNMPLKMQYRHLRRSFSGMFRPNANKQAVKQVEGNAKELRSFAEGD
jgi:hypothetical protein